MQLTKQQFIDRFTHPEFIGILNAAKTDVDVEAWLFRFNNADNPIETTDPRTIQGVESFVVKQLITQQRAEEILGTVLVWDGWHVGQMVTILPPFTTAYPDQYPIQALDPIAGVITVGKTDPVTGDVIVSPTGFDPMYVQAV